MLFSTWKTFRAPKDWTPGHTTWWLGVTSQKGKDKAFGQYIEDRKKETGYGPIEYLETVSN